MNVVERKSEEAEDCVSILYALQTLPSVVLPLTAALPTRRFPTRRGSRLGGLCGEEAETT